MTKFFYWAPRILSLLFIAFLSIFALDVFGEYQGWALVLALFMHLLPSLVLLIIVAIAWKYELVGAIAFLMAAFVYVWWARWAGRDFPWVVYATICGPAIIVATLFFLSWWQKRRVPSLEKNYESALTSRHTYCYSFGRNVVRLG